MSAKNTKPRHGPARALLDADPDTPVSKIPELLQSVERWECQGCGERRFNHPKHCSECGSKSFEKRIPEGGER